jgi:hypothetical protein
MAARIAVALLLSALGYATYRYAVRGPQRHTIVVKAPPTLSRGERLLLDTELFVEEFGKQAVNFLKNPRPPGTLFVEGVAEPRPAISAIVEKYGQPDRTEETPPRYRLSQRAILYYYDRVALAVAAADSRARVGWVILE